MLPTWFIIIHNFCQHSRLPQTGQSRNIANMGYIFPHMHCIDLETQEVHRVLIRSSDEAIANAKHHNALR